MTIRKVIRTAHNKGKPNELHSVEVAGVTYRSTWMAWQALGLGNSSKCERFRKQLKQSKTGALAYEDPDTGRVHNFELIPYNSKH